MANKFNNSRPGEGGAPSISGVGRRAGGAGGKDRTAAWPGLPGKAQPGTRDKSGTKKIPQSPKQEGI